MISFAAGPDGLADRSFSADLDLPAFPLNFDPQELLAEVDAGSDPQLNLQEMLELDIFGSPHALDAPANDASPNAPAGAPVHGSKDSMTSPSTGSQVSQQQATPGVFELFQLQHVVPSNAFSQPMQWPPQQPLPQQQEMQPAAQSSDAPQQQVYPQQYQLQQLPMQQQFLAPMQQPQQQFLYYAPSGFQQQQPLPLQQQQLNGYMLQSNMPQQTYFSAPNGSFTAQQPLYIPQQQMTAAAPTSATPFMMSSGYTMAPAGPAAGPLDDGQGQGLTLPPTVQNLAPVTVGSAGTGSGSLSSPVGISFQMPLGSPSATNGAAHAAAAGPARKGRSKAVAAPPPLGTEKPKGPSRRFRERQKETISTLEAEVTEKLAQLQALSAENELLKLRSAVLEATVKGREYHMRVIKEHGPPVFDAAEQRAADLAAHVPSGQDAESPGVSLCHSGVSAGSGLRAAFSDSEADAAGHTTDGETVLTHDLLHCISGVSSGATLAGASPTAAAANNGDCESLECCDAPQMCSAAQQRKTINVLKHMSAEDIIRHWKHFLHDVSAELLQAEKKEQHDKLRKLQQYGKDVDDDSTCTSAHECVGKTCRWCSNCDDPTVEHSEDNCRPAAEERAAAAAAAAQQGPSCVEAFNEGACCDVKPMAGTAGFGSAVQRQVSDCQSAGRCTASEGRIVALVNKYSYMCKFIALLNPGVLYHLFGRDLDTGLAVPYTDDHWRQVVSRLGLSKHQVTVILACAELYFSSLAKLLDQRRVLQQQLKQADEGLSECQKRLRGLDGIHNQLEVLESLASNLKREHVLRIMLNCFVWGRSLNSIQFAKSAVYSHPFFPDVHAMVCVLYEDARAMAPNGQPALVFPHRQHQKDSQIKQETSPCDQQQQQLPSDQQLLQLQQQQLSELQMLREQLTAQSEELRLQGIQARSGGASSGFRPLQVLLD